jgi:hypothetical protein
MKLLSDRGAPPILQSGVEQGRACPLMAQSGHGERDGWGPLVTQSGRRWSLRHGVEPLGYLFARLGWQ